MEQHELGGINLKKRFLEIEEALPFFPGRNGKPMKLRSMIVKLSREKVPGAIRLRTGKIIFDKQEFFK